MNYTDAIKSIIAQHYEGAAGHMLDQAFREEIHKLTKTQLKNWVNKAKRALNTSHKETLIVRKGMGYSSNDIAVEAYEKAWEVLGFDQFDSTLQI